MDLRGLLLVALIAMTPTAAGAHKPSDSYLTLSVTETAVEGRWDIALRDLEYAVGLDANQDGTITWGEVKARHEAIAAYALARVALDVGGARCALRMRDQLIARHSDGGYAVLRFTAPCTPSNGRLGVDYSLLFDLDQQHRGLLRLERDGATQTAIFEPERRRAEFQLGRGDPWRTLAAFVREGVWHIWIGYDHILFLLTLLLPAVVVRGGGGWKPVEGLGAAFLAVARIVTAFTLAHSVTLSLAALDVVALPTRLVESAIAASVLAAALNNLWPVVTRRLWLVAFGFGLVHGFGFASVLSDLGLPGDARVLALLGFNLGVEAGQLAIVAAVLPLAYGVRHRAPYPRFALPAGSAAAAIIGGLWLLERSLGLDLPLV